MEKFRDFLIEKRFLLSLLKLLMLRFLLMDAEMGFLKGILGDSVPG